MKYTEFSIYKSMRAGALNARTLDGYLRGARGTHKAFRKGWEGIVRPYSGGCLYPRGTIQAAAWYAGRDARAGWLPPPPSVTPVVRFWVHVHGSPVKFTLRGEQVIHLFEGGATEEGYSYTHTWYCLDEQGLPYRAWSTDSSDCDGRMTSTGKQRTCGWTVLSKMVYGEEGGWT